MDMVKSTLFVVNETCSKTLLKYYEKDCSSLLFEIKANTRYLGADSAWLPFAGKQFLEGQPTKGYYLEVRICKRQMPWCTFQHFVTT